MVSLRLSFFVDKMRFLLLNNTMKVKIYGWEIALLPTRNTIIDHINGRNEKILATFFLLFFVFCFSNQNFIDQYPVLDYDLNDPQDRMAVEYHKTAISDDELAAHIDYLKRIKGKK